MKGRLLTVIIGILILLTACTTEQSSVSSPASPSGPLQIRTQQLPIWEAPGSATYKLDIAGGVPPYSFSASALPQGFNIGPDGTIGGMARLPEGTSHSESPPFTIIVTDSAGTTTQASFTIRIIEKNTIQIITTPVTCILDQQCDEQIATADGGNPPYSFQSDSFMEGAPPFGTQVDINGHLTGKPSKAGEYTVGVCVKDTIGNQRCGKAAVTVEKGIQLTGTWSGHYGETETSDYCTTSNSGTLTISVTESDGAFSGTVDDTGTASAGQSSEGASCEGGAFHLSGTVEGTIVGDTLSGTMQVSNSDSHYELPFTATLTTDTMTGSYSGTGAFDGGSSRISAGSFKLTKKT